MAFFLVAATLYLTALALAQDCRRPLVFAPPPTPMMYIKRRYYIYSYSQFPPANCDYT